MADQNLPDDAQSASDEQSMPTGDSFPTIATDPTQKMPEAQAAPHAEWDPQAAAQSVASAAATTQPAQVYGQSMGQAAYDQTYAQTDYGQTYTQQGYATAPAAPYTQAAPSYTGTGTTSLVLGILSILFVGPIGLILGIVAMVKGKKSLALDAGDGRAKAGRITGIVGLILSILAIIFTIVLVVGLITAANNPQVQNYIQQEIAEDIDGFEGEFNHNSGNDGSVSGNLGAGAGTAGQDPTTGSTNTGEEDAVRAVVAENLDEILVFDDANRKQLSSIISDGFSRETGFGLESLGGVTADEFTDWMLEGLDYTVGAVRVNGNTATAEVLVTSRDLDAFSDIVEDKVDAWMAGDEYGTIESIDVLYERVGSLMSDAMKETGMHTEDVELLLVKEGDSWKLDTAAQNKLYSELFSSDAY